MQNRPKERVNSTRSAAEASGCQKDHRAIYKRARICAYIAGAALIVAPAKAAEQRLAGNGHIFWDGSGEIGDIVIVRILPKANDRRIVVALYGELRRPGEAVWFPLPVSKAGYDFGYSSRRIAGAVQSSMVVFPQGTDPVDVPLQIPAFAYYLPAGQFTLRYRVRTLLTTATASDAWADDKVVSELEEIARRKETARRMLVDSQSAPSFSGARASSPPKQGMNEPLVKKFTLVNP
jgi:hypothetical protein